MVKKTHFYKIKYSYIFLLDAIPTFLLFIGFTKSDSNVSFNLIFTVARELYEESNGAFYYSTENDKKPDNKQYLSIENLEKIIYNNEYKQIYVKTCKYLLYFVKLPTSINIDFEKSGDFEAYDKIKRNLQWITLADLLNKYSQNKIHIRLRNKSIIYYLRNII